MRPLDMSGIEPTILAANSKAEGGLDHAGTQAKGAVDVEDQGAPKAGEAGHFRRYAPENIPYAIERFTNEINRLYGVMNKRLKDHRFLAGAYSIADMACVGWIRHAERQGETFIEFPNLKRWLDVVR